VSIEWEVLVVDNNSSDQTRQVAYEFCRRQPSRFRYVFEPHQGKSHALNTGIGESRGEVLAFTDDDVTVDRAWLRNLTAALHGGEWSGAGGRTLPMCSFSPPRWLATEGRYELAPLGIFDRGLEAGELTESPYGNNMAYRKEMFEKHGGFRPDLGPQPRGRGPQKSEDSEFGCRLLAAGERLRYEPAAVAYHAIPEYRVQKKYFLAWWYDKARADVRAFGIPTDAKWHIAGIPVYLIRRFSVWTLRWMASVRSSKRFSSKLKVWGLFGAIVQCYQLAHSEKPPKEKRILSV
jgi:glycosyltransferase involved in cell wall biosynthesis